MERWKDGMVEGWNNGMVEVWKNVEYRITNEEL